MAHTDFVSRLMRRLYGDSIPPKPPPAPVPVKAADTPPAPKPPPPAPPPPKKEPAPAPADASLLALVTTCGCGRSTSHRGLCHYRRERLQRVGKLASRKPPPDPVKEVKPIVEAATAVPKASSVAAAGSVPSKPIVHGPKPPNPSSGMLPPTLHSRIFSRGDHGMTYMRVAFGWCVRDKNGNKMASFEDEQGAKDWIDNWGKPASEVADGKKPFREKAK